MSSSFTNGFSSVAIRQPCSTVGSGIQSKYDEDYTIIEYHCSQNDNSSTAIKICYDASQNVSYLKFDEYALPYTKEWWSRINARVNQKLRSGIPANLISIVFTLGQNGKRAAETIVHEEGIVDLAIKMYITEENDVLARVDNFVFPVHSSSRIKWLIDELNNEIKTQYNISHSDDVLEIEPLNSANKGNNDNDKNTNDPGP